ncbi:MAG: GIY-YIG nuclease family protein [Pacificimonas sp.]|nr:GIY-YIG nuclease family protein [Pacificimonas sp.]
MRSGYVYLLASARNGTLYLGVTSDIERRISEHRQGDIPGFSKAHGVKRLVWYETHDRIDAAIAREKAIKKWRRAWKLDLIERMNPDWDDLAVTLIGMPPLEDG